MSNRRFRADARECRKGLPEARRPYASRRSGLVVAPSNALPTRRRCVQLAPLAAFMQAPSSSAYRCSRALIASVSDVPMLPLKQEHSSALA